MRLPPLGWPLRTFVLVTRTLLITSQEGPVGPERFVGYVEAEHSTRDAKLRAYDKRSGRLLDEIVMPANATGSPMSYFAGGRQFIGRHWRLESARRTYFLRTAVRTLHHFNPCVRRVRY